MLEQTLLNKFCCLIGFHNWYEPTMNFFNPKDVREECLNCDAKRHRFDKRREKDAWRKRKRWF